MMGKEEGGGRVFIGRKYNWEYLYQGGGGGREGS